MQAPGDKDTAEEVIPDEAIRKYMAKKADASTAQNTHNRPETSKEKLKILARS